MGAFALRDFIFMMGELQVDAAAVNVEGLTQIFAGHRAAFDMPARAATAPGRIPAWKRIVRRLPQHEIHRVLLVGRHFHPRTRDHLVQAAARQLAVIGLGRHIEQHMAIGGIGMASSNQLFDDAQHLRNMLGGTRRHAGRQVAQGGDIFFIDARGFLGQGPDGDAALGGARVDLVVHVGDVADIGDMRVAIDVAQQPEQHIEDDHGPRIADMGEVVNRGAADIHAHVLRIDRRELVFGLGQGVEEAQGHRTARKRRGRKRFRQTEKLRARSAANSNSGLTRNDHAVSPLSRATDLSRPIRGNSFLSSGPCSSPVSASLNGWNSPLPLAPVWVETALVQAPHVS